MFDQTDSKCTDNCTLLPDQCWNEDLLYKHIKEFSKKEGLIFLDVGANIGDITSYVSSIHNIERVFSVEMAPDTFNLLKSNLKGINTFNKVKLINVALSNKTGEVNVFPGNGVSETFNILGSRFEHEQKTGFRNTVKSITLNDLSYKLNCIFDLIKIDVEGAETLVISGGIDIISKALAVFVEIHTEETFLEICNLCNDNKWDLYCSRFLHKINTVEPSIKYCYQVIIKPNNR